MLAVSGMETSFFGGYIETVGAHCFGDGNHILNIPGIHTFEQLPCRVHDPSCTVGWGPVGLGTELNIASLVPQSY